MSARYSHLSAHYLGDAVRALDGVFGVPCYQDATKPTKLLSEKAESD